MHQIQPTHSVARPTALGAVFGAGFGFFVTGPSLFSSGFADTVLLMAAPLILAFAVLAGGITGTLCLFQAEEASEAATTNNEDVLHAATWDPEDAHPHPAA